jgi:hypothetical protein
MPDFDMKYQDHKHFTPWLHLLANEEDKFTFQYVHCNSDTLDSGGTPSALRDEYFISAL